MATGGQKPGITVRATVTGKINYQDGAVGVTFTFADNSDANYFKEDNEYVAFFLPAPPVSPASGSGESGNG